MVNALKNNELPAQYCIYIYHKPTNESRLSKWERVGATHSMRRAVTQAKLLHKRQKYEKIEVKERTFCSSEKRFKGKTLRSYEKNVLPWQNLFRMLKINTEYL